MRVTTVKSFQMNHLMLFTTLLNENWSRSHQWMIIFCTIWHTEVLYRLEDVVPLLSHIHGVFGYLFKLWSSILLLCTMKESLKKDNVWRGEELTLHEFHMLVLSCLCILSSEEDQYALGIVPPVGSPVQAVLPSPHLPHQTAQTVSARLDHTGACAPPA